MIEMQNLLRVRSLTKAQSGPLSGRYILGRKRNLPAWQLVRKGEDSACSEGEFRGIVRKEEGGCVHIIVRLWSRSFSLGEECLLLELRL